MSQFGLLKSGEIHHKWDQITRAHNMSGGSVSTKNYYYVWPRILPISLLIVFTAPSTVPGPWQVTYWIFYKFRKQLWYTEQKDFLKTFLEIPFPLPTHSTTSYSKNRKASIVKCCCFSLSPGSYKRGLMKLSVHSSWIFYLLKPKQNSTHFFKRYSWSIPWTRLVCGLS